MTTRQIISAMIGMWLVAQPCAQAAEVSFCPFPGTRFGANVESLLERRWKNVSRQGYEISCGSAALSTIMRYQYGDTVTEQELIQAILKQVAQKDVNQRGGFTLLDLKKVAVARGYMVHGYKLTLPQLAKLHAPALVPVTIRGFKHFIVVRGMIGDRVVIADPAFGNLLVPDFQFEPMWSHIVMVFERQGNAPIPADLRVSDDDLHMDETQSAIRSSLQQRELNFEVSPDEF